MPVGLKNKRVESLAHGTRSRYTGGCRCDECRTANRTYEHARYRRAAEEGGNPLVSTDEVRAHVLALSAAGVGRRAVAQAADVAESTIGGIRAGSHPRIRRDVARRILAVDEGAAADGGMVPSDRTRAALAQLEAHGLTRTEVAKRLGLRSPAIQFGREARVRATTELRVLRLLRQVEAELEEVARLRGFCDVCDEVHSPRRRARLLATCASWPAARVHAEHPHWYPSTTAGARLLREDRAAMRRTARTAP